MATPKIALMTYAIDGRQAKGTALVARKVTERLLHSYQGEFDFTLVHYDHSDDPIYTMGAREMVMPKFPHLPFGTRFVRFLLFCWKYRNEPFDIVHWFQPRLYPFFWLVPARHIVVTAHAAGDITAPRSFRSFSRAVFNAVLILFNRKIDRLLVVSEFARQEVIEHYRADPSRVVVAYNGGGEEYRSLESIEIEPILSRYHIEQPYILSMSRFQPHKNVETLIEAYSQMRRDHNERKEKLILVGTPVHGYAAPQEAIERSRYKDDISTIAYVEQADLNAIYAGASLFAFPSRNEGFGLPVIEAMASGTPVVTTNVTSLPEISGGAAICIDPDDANSLADALAHVLGDENERRKLIGRGLSRAQRFTWDESTVATVATYRAVL
jgi:alpha-1,3-rhamnosyl/mannosyltransferase